MDYRMAILPGFPRPLTTGAHYEALRAATATNGQALPIQADREGLVWAGRTMFNVCLELGVEPRIDVVTDGYAAAVAELASRDLTVLETADLVATVLERVSAESALTGNKKSAAASAWFRDRLGKERGFSPRQVELYLRLARATPEQRQRVAHARSLNSAISKLDGAKQGRTPAQPPKLAEQLVVLIETLSSDAPLNADDVALLQGLHSLIGDIVRTSRTESAA